MSHHYTGEQRNETRPQDWEDSHGAAKTTLQHVLLPHEIISCFLSEGDVLRMTGSVSWLKFFHTKQWYYIHGAKPSPRTFGTQSFVFKLRIWWAFGMQSGTLTGLRTTPSYQCLGWDFQIQWTHTTIFSHQTDGKEISNRIIIIHFPICSSEDPATDLNYVIPIRLYGDGAEAQRNLV